MRKYIIIIVIITLLYIIFKPYQYTDDEVAVMKEQAKIESVIISDMLQYFQFKGQPMEFPCKVEDLPEGFTVDKIAPIAYFVNYDVEILLRYEGDTIALCTKTPKEDSIIFEFFTDDAQKNSNLITIKGIGIGSTEEELLQVFPDYNKPFEESVEEGDTYRLFGYVSEKGYNEQISFVTKNGVVYAIDILNN